MAESSSRGNVCISVPWRDKAWLLPHTLDSIVNLDYPKEKLGMRFIVNDCKDNTFRMLMQFKREFSEKYRFISIWTFNMGSASGRGRDGVVVGKNSWHMQLLKNILRDALSRKDEYWFYMDSDVLLSPDTLRLLVQADKDVIAGMCRYYNDCCEPSNFMVYDPHVDRFGREFDKKLVLASDTPVKIDLVTGVMLFRYWVAKKISFYQASKNEYAEDEGAMRDMMKLGVERWIHPWVMCEKIGDVRALESYIENTGKKGLNLTNEIERESDGE